jgi:hypothetical protein
MIGVACRRSLSITVTHRPLDQVEHVAGIVDGNELRGRVERRCPTRPSVAPDTIAGWPKRIVTRPPGRSVSVASGSRSIGTAMKLADGFVREIRMHWLVTVVAPARCSRRCIRQSIKPSLHAACPATHRATLPLRRGSVSRRRCVPTRVARIDGRLMAGASGPAIQQNAADGNPAIPQPASTDSPPLSYQSTGHSPVPFRFDARKMVTT